MYTALAAVESKSDKTTVAVSTCLPMFFKGHQRNLQQVDGAPLQAKRQQ